MTDSVFRILIVDDESNIRMGLSKALASEMYEISTAEDAASAWVVFCRECSQLVITDLKMPGSLSGLDLVQQIKHERPETLVLVITLTERLKPPWKQCAWALMTTLRSPLIWKCCVIKCGRRSNIIN
jgi:DNA-binding NtrC family response regulator